MSHSLHGFGDLLRGPAAKDTHGPLSQHVSRRRHLYDRRNIESQIELGVRVAAFMELEYGHLRSKDMLQHILRRAIGSQPSSTADPIEVIDLVEVEDEDASHRLPFGFWRKFIKYELLSQYSKKKVMQLSRSLELIVLRKHHGAVTSAGMRGMRDKHSYRSDGGALNSRKAAGLGFMLLQFFVDRVQRIMCRADSALMMAKARELRAELAAGGLPQCELPKLIGNAGRAWLLRWRRMYGISRKVTGMKLQVPWVKIKRRIRCFLGNVFRLRAFWELCHPGKPMRFLSLDQKPSWFNNAGRTGSSLALRGGSQPRVREDHDATRQRYSILTAVPSWGHDNPDVDEPPKIAILFRAKPGGRVLEELQTCKHLKPWMKVQVQENGSYRSEDVVDALEFMLPVATKSEESIILMLDWYSGHLTEEVSQCVRDKGHVLLFHGGGCTPFSQVNDTHLHSQMARLLTQFEVDWAFHERSRLLSRNDNRTPKLTRSSIIGLVQNVWLSIDHKRVSEKGYKQTGPGMPLRGPVDPKDVFANLLEVMQELDSSSTPIEVGMNIRDEAVAFVEEGFNSSKWTSWADCHKLIQEQDGLDEALAEGLEAFGAAAKDETDDEGTDESDDDEGDDDGGGGGPGGGGGDAKPTGADGDLGDDAAKDDGATGSHVDGGEDGPGGDGGGVVPVVGAASAEPSVEIVAARQLLFDDAVKRRDNVLMNYLRKQIRAAATNKKDSTTDVALLLRKRFREEAAEESKSRRDALKEDLLAAKDMEDSKAKKAKAQQAAEEARCASLQQILVNRRDADARRDAWLLEKAKRRWLQTEYPSKLAYTCMHSYMGRTIAAKNNFQDFIKQQLAMRVFERQVLFKDLWDSDKLLTIDFSVVASPFGGPPRHVRCSLPLLEVIEKVGKKSMSPDHDAVATLQTLWGRCVPESGRIFTAAYTPLRLLHYNDYVMEKTFVYGILALSKWLGSKAFPAGIYGQWPPAHPKDLVPEGHGSQPSHLAAPSGAACLPPGASSSSSSSA